MTDMVLSKAAELGIWLVPDRAGEGAGEGGFYTTACLSPRATSPGYHKSSFTAYGAFHAGEGIPVYEAEGIAKSLS
jgi:hypothetical protein